MISIIWNLVNVLLSFWRKGDKTPEFNPPPPPDVSPDQPPFDSSRVYMDYAITDKYHKGWKRSLDSITEICLHHTENDSAIGLMKWMKDTGRSGYKKGIGLFPLLVSKHGEVYKIGALSRWWYASECGQHDSKVINIEICHHTGDFTPEQYETLYWLVFEYIPYHCKNLETITGHDCNRKKYSNLGGKGCPSQWMKWDKFVEEGIRRSKHLLRTDTCLIFLHMGEDNVN